MNLSLSLLTNPAVLTGLALLTLGFGNRTVTLGVGLVLLVLGIFVL